MNSLQNSTFTAKKVLASLTITITCFLLFQVFSVLFIDQSSNLTTVFAQTTSPEPSPSIEPSPSASSSPSPTTCAADINQNGQVGLEDYSILVTDFLSTSPSNVRSDINGSGLVDLTDYSLLVATFFQSC